MMADIFLISIMASLAVIELALIFSIRKLTKVLLRMDEKIKKFERMTEKIHFGIIEITQKMNALDFLKNSKFHVTGNTALGNVDVDIELGSKKEIKTV